MKNPIISELRRIRDANAKRHHNSIASIARELMEIEPSMEKKTYTLHRGKLVPLSSLHRKLRSAMANGNARGHHK